MILCLKGQRKSSLGRSFCCTCLNCVTEWWCCHYCFNLNLVSTKQWKKKEFNLLIFEGEKKPIVLLEKQLHKHGVCGIASYLETLVEDLANNKTDSLNVTLYKYLNVFIRTSMCLWVCVTKIALSKIKTFEWWGISRSSVFLCVSSKCKTCF